ncbi:hypothetical protein TKK_0000779 [Trichogramma kaykai]
MDYNERTMEKMKNLRSSTDWANEGERKKLLARLYDLCLYDWQGKPPNFQDVFADDELDWLLVQAAIDTDDDNAFFHAKRFIKLLAHSGFKDRPKLDEDGKPLIRRTTGLHHVGRSDRPSVSLVRRLFKIYDRHDLNYVDDAGFSHFHVACKLGRVEVVRKLLESGQDPNCVVPETGESPLYLAMAHERARVVEALLRAGADPNLANKEGETPLHVAAKGRCDEDDLMRTFFGTTNELGRAVNVDAVDGEGCTPLRWAMLLDRKPMIEALLRNGADPNSTDAEGYTTLHVICKRDEDDGMIEIVFKACEEKELRLKVDALDEKGRTPLQLAVANFLPHTVEFLLDHGADLSGFVFPAERDFDERYEERRYEFRGNFKLQLVSGALAIIECLEKKGYQLDRNDATTIMKYFAKYGLIEDDSADELQRLCSSKKFARRAKRTKMANSGLSLHDLLQLPPEELERRLAYLDCFDLVRFYDSPFIPYKYADACADRLGKILPRKFFRRWALDSLLELTRAHCSLPILCGEIIVELLTYDDLCRVCLAAAGYSSSC